MSPVHSRDYVGLLSGIYYSILVGNTMWLVNTPTKHDLLTQYRPNVEPASTLLGSIRSDLVSTSCWQYRHDALDQSCINVGPLSATLAHSQIGAKHDTVTQYWTYVGSVRRRWANISPALGHCLVFEHLHDRKCRTEMNGTQTHRNTEQTNVNQYAPTSVYKGET